MAVPNNMDALEWLRKHLEEDSGDLLREMVKSFAEQLMAAEVNAMCGASYSERTHPSGWPSAMAIGGETSIPGRERSRSPSEAPPGQLLPGLAARAPASGLDTPGGSPLSSGRTVLGGVDRVQRTLAQSTEAVVGQRAVQTDLASTRFLGLG